MTPEQLAALKDMLDKLDTFVYMIEDIASRSACKELRKAIEAFSETLEKE